MCLNLLKFNFFRELCCTKQNKHNIKNLPKCTYEQCLSSGYTENGKNQEFKSTKTSQTHCFGKLKRLASSTVLVYQNSSFSTVLALLNRSLSKPFTAKATQNWTVFFHHYGTPHGGHGQGQGRAAAISTLLKIQAQKSVAEKFNLHGNRMGTREYSCWQRSSIAGAAEARSATSAPTYLPPDLPPRPEKNF